MSKEVLLKEATRNQLIAELKSRESITSYAVLQRNGATIKNVSGKISVSGEAYIFVIEPNK